MRSLGVEGAMPRCEGCAVRTGCGGDCCVFLRPTQYCGGYRVLSAALMCKTCRASHSWRSCEEEEACRELSRLAVVAGEAASRYVSNSRSWTEGYGGAGQRAETSVWDANNTQKHKRDGGGAVRRVG